MQRIRYFTEPTVGTGEQLQIPIRPPEIFLENQFPGTRGIQGVRQTRHSGLVMRLRERANAWSWAKHRRHTDALISMSTRCWQFFPPIQVISWLPTPPNGARHLIPIYILNDCASPVCGVPTGIAPWIGGVRWVGREIRESKLAHSTPPQCRCAAILVRRTDASGCQSRHRLQEHKTEIIVYIIPG